MLAGIITPSCHLELDKATENGESDGWMFFVKYWSLKLQLGGGVTINAVLMDV